MLNYIKRMIERKRLKETFKEYGFEIKRFQIDGLGKVEYAQWLHPFEGPKEITSSNIKFYQRLTNKGGMIIDIGAHTGDTTIPMAIAVGKEGMVLGFEPNKYVYRILEKNASLNPDFTNIIPQCLAATDKDGKFIFNYSDASFCNGGFLSQIKNKRHHHNYTLEVNGINLQNYLLRKYPDDLKKLDLIKIDTEGYDKEILKTIPQIINKYKPNLIIECYKKLNKEERNELFDVINGFDYNIYYIKNFELFEKLIRIEKIDMTNRDHFDMLAIHKSKKLSVQ